MMCMQREIDRLTRRYEADRSAWAAYEVTRDAARAEWIERGGLTGDAAYEAARRLAWAAYEEAITAAYYDMN